MSAPKKQLGTFVLARKTTRDRLTEEKSSCVQQREDGEGSDLRRGECIVLPIDEANKCHRARDRGRRAWLVLGNHVGWMGGRGTNLPTHLHYHQLPFDGNVPRGGISAIWPSRVGRNTGGFGKEDQGQDQE